MKYFCRWICNAAAVLCIGLCVILVLLSIRSAKSLDSIEYTNSAGRYVALQSYGSGYLRFVVAHNAPGPFGFSILPSVPHGRIRDFFPTQVYFLGGAATAQGTITHWFNPAGQPLTVVRRPYQALALSDVHLTVLAFLTALVCLMLARLQKPRQAVNPCPACGAILPGTPDRCPECGAVIPAPQVKPTT